MLWKIIIVLIVLGVIGAVLQWIGENLGLFILIVLSVLGFVFFRTPVFFVCDAIAWVLFFVIKALNEGGGFSGRSHTSENRENEKKVDNDSADMSGSQKNEDFWVPMGIPNDIRDALIKCNDTILTIKKINNNIPDINMTNRIDETEKLLKELVKEIILDPNNGKKLTRFADYYLPLAEKLLSQYEALESSSINDPSAQKIRSDIERGIDTLNMGIYNYIVELRDYKNMDIESDVEVMKNLMQQDGLM